MNDRIHSVQLRIEWIYHIKHREEGIIERDGMIMKEYNGLPIRGVHIDLKAYTLNFEMMCMTARKVAKLGYNTILLEYQDKFPFDGALASIPEVDTLTREQICVFDRLCAELGIEIIPIVQCLGHMHYVLRREKYSWLADSAKPMEIADVICPSRKESFDLFASMAQQVMDLHSSSRYFHIGGDEAELSEQCPACGEKPKYRRLMDHYRKCIDYITDMGKKPIMWCDMLLGHPEIIDELRGRVVIMDWNYSSTGARGERALLWGGIDPDNPESWPPLHQRLFRDYVYTCEPYIMNPFPYVRFLQDNGFEVIVAPAAQCGGDSFYAPQPHHINNCREAVRTAVAAKALGVIVTVWSIRRVPWPQIENSLIAAAMTMSNPAVTDKETDTAFALDSFGVADCELARIPDIIGSAVQEVHQLCAVAAQCDACVDIGVVSDYARNRERLNQSWENNMSIAPACTRLKEAAKRAQELLGQSCPKNAEQELRVMLWQLSIDTADLMSRYVPYMAETTIPSKEAENFIAEFEALGERWENALKPLYTPFSMKADNYARAGLHIDYLRQFV